MTTFERWGAEAMPWAFAATGLALGAGAVALDRPLSGLCGAVAGVTAGLLERHRANNAQRAVSALRLRLRDQREKAEENAAGLRRQVRELQAEIWQRDLDRVSAGAVAAADVEVAAARAEAESPAAEVVAEAPAGVVVDEAPVEAVVAGEPAEVVAEVGAEEPGEVAAEVADEKSGEVVAGEPDVEVVAGEPAEGVAGEGGEVVTGPPSGPIARVIDLRGVPAEEKRVDPETGEIPAAAAG